MIVLLAALVLVYPLIADSSPNKRELSLNDADHKDNRLFKRKGGKKRGSRKRSSRKWSSPKNPFYYPPKQVIVHHTDNVICWPSPAPSTTVVKTEIKTIYIILTVTAPAPTIPNYQSSTSKTPITSTATSQTAITAASTHLQYHSSNQLSITVASTHSQNHLSNQLSITVASTHSQNHLSNQPSITAASTHSQNHSSDQPAFRDTPNILLQDHITTETQSYLETSIYMPITSSSGADTLSYSLTEYEVAQETAIGISNSDPNGSRLILDFPNQSPVLELDAPNVPDDRPASSAMDLQALEYMLYFCILIGMF